MNPRIIKEIRPLVPAFALTVCGPVIALIARDHSELVINSGLLLSAFGCILMGVATFGDEFINRTMPMLLCQPFARRTIWREKMTALAVALAALVAVFLIWAYLMARHPFVPGTTNLILIMFVIMLLFGLGVFCTTPFWTLSLKNIPSAVVGSAGMPVGLGIIMSAVPGAIIDHLPALKPPGKLAVEASVLLPPLLAYFFVCYRAGRRAFLKLEAFDIQMPEVALPAGMEQALVRPFKAMIPRFTGPWSSLINKELHLQRVNFLLASMFCILVPLEYVAWKLTTWEFGKEIALTLLVTTFVIYGILVPLISGACCVAEEKNWNIHEWHLTLPPSRSKQWCVKVLVALMITVLLGIVLPSIYLAIGNHWEPGLIYPAVFLLFVACLGIFASSVSTNSMRAIILTIALVIMAIAAAVYGHVAADSAGEFLVSHLPADTYGSLGWLAVIILASALSCAMGGLILYLGFLNYQTGATSPRRRWAHSALILVAIWAASSIISLFLHYLSLPASLSEIP